MKFEKSETLQCVINAFAGESIARNKYTFYAKQAKKEKYDYISSVFIETADNEQEHAKLLYKYIPSGEHYYVKSSYPFFLGNTQENLYAAFKSEQEEGVEVYAYALKIAKEEGFDDIANLFIGIIEIEKHHAYRFERLAAELKNGTLYNKEEQHQWICKKCGHILISHKAPAECPVCGHPQGYFQLFGEKF